MKKIKNSILQIILVATSVFTLASCNSNDDVDLDKTLAESGITITGDADCCSAEEALQVYNFLKTVKNIPELNREIDGKYKVFAYSKTGTFVQGYNDIYFVATKKSSGNYVKDFQVSNVTPLMYMTAMNMEHSTPVATEVGETNEAYKAVRHGWISFVMSSSDNGTWSLSYNFRVLKAEDKIERQAITVNALPSGQKWLNSFKIGSDVYHISLVNPDEWQTGTNTIKAYITKKANVITTPWTPTDKKFTIEITPTMPDMGHHTSPGNTPLLQQSDNSYKGTINLTMTGLWRIHLTVKDASGNVVAGGDNLKDGFSSLYFDVTI